MQKATILSKFVNIFRGTGPLGGGGKYSIPPKPSGTKESLPLYTEGGGIKPLQTPTEKFALGSQKYLSAAHCHPLCVSLFRNVFNMILNTKENKRDEKNKHLSAPKLGLEKLEGELVELEASVVEVEGELLREPLR